LFYLSLEDACHGDIRFSSSPAEDRGVFFLIKKVESWVCSTYYYARLNAVKITRRSCMEELELSPLKYVGVGRTYYVEP
jgi:hypothetical protein